MVKKGIPEAVILGFSDGANIAMKFALRYPDKVTALILNSGNLDVKGLKSTVRIPIELGYKLTGLFAGVSETAKRREELLGLMVNEPNIKPKELRLIQAPTLVIAGTNDMIKRAHTQQIARNIPSARLSIIQGNHFVANKRPDSFNKEVELFLETISTAK